MSDKVLIISADCHAGALPSIYNEYMPAKYHEAANAWWVTYTREMMSRVGTFFDQEAVEAYAEKAGQGGGRMKAMSDPTLTPSDEDFLEMLSDPSNPFAPRRVGRLRSPEGDRRRHERGGSDLSADGAFRRGSHAIPARRPGRFAEEDIRALLGLNAANVYGFDVDALLPVAQEIGPSIAEIRDEAESNNHSNQALEGHTWTATS